MKLRTILAGAMALSLLAACGGGNDDEVPTADGRKVPSSALVSATAYSQWAASLANSETGEPVEVEAGMTAPKSETEDPIVVR